jgi:hypothetical protein
MGPADTNAPDAVLCESRIAGCSTCVAASTTQLRHTRHVRIGCNEHSRCESLRNGRGRSNSRSSRHQSRARVADAARRSRCATQTGSLQRLPVRQPLPTRIAKPPLDPRQQRRDPLPQRVRHDPRRSGHRHHSQLDDGCRRFRRHRGGPFIPVRVVSTRSLGAYFGRICSPNPLCNRPHSSALRPDSKPLRPAMRSQHHSDAHGCYDRDARYAAIPSRRASSL